MKVFLYVRDKEQALIHDNNRRLIANDLIAELVQANQTMRGELKQIVDAVQMQQQQAQQQQRGRGAPAARGGKERIINEQF
jgi:hypothetical protein